MARPCTVQAHLESTHINMMIRQGVPNRRIASHFRLQEASVRRHAKHIDACAPAIDASIDAAPIQSTQGIDAVSTHIDAGASHHEPPTPDDSLTGILIILEQTSARQDRYEEALGQMMALYRTLEAVLLPTLRQVLVHLQQKPSLEAGEPAEPETRLAVDEVEVIEADTMSGDEVIRRAVRVVQRTWKAGTRQERKRWGLRLQEGLQGLTSGEVDYAE